MWASHRHASSVRAHTPTSTGKISALWTGTPTTVRLDDLDIICLVLQCTTADLPVHEPEVAAARRPQAEPQSATGSASVVPRLGRGRTLPPL
ncbi:hypothetical protein GCM10020295_47150 [Streptomyces cinereospinus]